MYYEKYGFLFDPGFGLEISNDGSFIVVVGNGCFQPRQSGNGHEHPPIVVIEIPEEERPLD